jgi:hypothetical protein
MRALALVVALIAVGCSDDRPECASYYHQMQNVLISGTACAGDGDCMLAETHCGFPAACGAALNLAAEQKLIALQTDFESARCPLADGATAPGACACQSQPASAIACRAGACVCTGSACFGN